MKSIIKRNIFFLTSSIFHGAALVGIIYLGNNLTSSFKSNNTVEISTIFSEAVKKESPIQTKKLKSAPEKVTAAPVVSTESIETISKNSSMIDPDKSKFASPSAGTEGVRILNIDQVTRSVRRTESAINQNIEGKIRMKLLIDEFGQLQKITPMNEMGYGLDEVAIAAAKKLIFKPARVNSKFIPLEIIYTVNFSIRYQ